MIRNRIILRILPILFLALFVSAKVAAQHRGVQVRLMGQELLETGPQNLVTATLEVINISDEPLEFLPEINLPEGWKLITPSFPFHLAPRKSEMRLVSFLVPQTAMAGQYEITYRVRSEKYSSISDVAKIFVGVFAVTKLAVQRVETPEYVVAGDDYEARFSVINQSNTAIAAMMTVQSGQDLPFVLEPEKTKLAAGEAATVRVRVKTDKTVRKGFIHHLVLTARSIDDETIHGESRSTTGIVPRITGEVDRFHKIPAEITLRTVGHQNDEKNLGFQGIIYGRGPLDEDNDNEIEFLFKGPNTLDNHPVFGEYDGYFAGFRSNGLGVRVGDSYYSLSRLTEQSLQGRGIAGSLNQGSFEFGGYHMKTRRLDPKLQESAFHLGYGFYDRYKLGVNFLNKKSADEDSTIASLEGQFHPWEYANIEFEAAYGKSDHQKDYAWWLNFFGSPAWGGSYRIEYIRAEPDFPGYYRNKEYVSGSYYYPVRKNFTLNASLRQEKTNPDRDPLLGPAGLNRFGQLGMNYSLKTGTTLSAETRYRTYEDRLPEPAFNYDELTLRGRIGQRFQKFFFNFSAEFGQTKDRLRDQTSDLSIYEGSFYFMPTNRQTFGGYVRYGTRQVFEKESRDSLNTGLSAFFKLGTSTDLRFKIDRYDTLGNNPTNRHIFDLGINHQFSNKNRVSSYGRHTSFDKNSGQKDETAFILEYTVPLGLPVTKKKSVGMLSGYVRDQETGHPLSNAILRMNGATAVTNRSGEFVFPALKPETFHLDIDSGSIGLDQIPTVKTPIEVQIQGGEKTPVDITITTKAELAGRVVVYEFAEKNAPGTPLEDYPGKKMSHKDSGVLLVEKSGLANCLVEIESGQDTWRILTDRNGRFGFNDLRPGRWTIRVYASHLPKYHYFEKDILDIELYPGKKREILTKVLPRKRTIQMIEQVETVIEEKRK